MHFKDIKYTISSNSVKIIFISILSVLYIVRSAFPYVLNNIYYFFLLASLIYLWKVKLSDIKDLVKENYKFYLPYFSILVLFSFASIKTTSLYVFKEIIIGATAFYISFLWIYLIKSKKDFTRTLKLTFKLSFIFILSIVILSFFLNLKLPSLLNRINLHERFSLTSDYNIYSLILLFALIIITFKYFQKNSFIVNLLLSLAFYLISLNILLTGSRRGILILFIVFTCLFISFIAGVISKRKYFKTVFNNLKYIVLLIISVSFISLFLFFNTSKELKHQQLTKFGLNYNFKINITYPLSRYSGIAYNKLFDFIWNNEYPDSWSFIHNKSIQYYLDEKYLLKDVNYFSNPYLSDNYKGIKKWGNSDLYFYNTPNDTINFIYSVNHALNDGFMFDINVPRKTDITSTAFIYILNWNKNLRLMTLARGRYISASINPLWQVNEYWYMVSLKANYSEEDVPRVYFLGGDASNPSISIWTGFFSQLESAENDFNRIHNIISQVDIDILKNLNFDEIENVTNDPLEKIPDRIPRKKEIKKENIEIDEQYKKLGWFMDRAVRWGYAKDIWLNDYNFLNKIFGKGFKYLELYGAKFHNNSQFIDYPHNPIVSSVLYSGFFGGLIYLCFVLYVLYLYISNREIDLIMKFLFFITFFYSFFSGNSQFSIPAFTLFTMFPFIYKSFDNIINPLEEKS